VASVARARVASVARARVASPAPGKADRPVANVVAASVSDDQGKVHLRPKVAHPSPLIAEVHPAGRENVDLYRVARGHRPGTARTRVATIKGTGRGSGTAAPGGRQVRSRSNADLRTLPRASLSPISSDRARS
jgi:hypothetical protein